MSVKASVRPHGTLKSGEEAQLFTLSNANGVTVEISTYGGTITSIRVPDKNGKIDDVVLGFDTLADYESRNSAYFGVTCGRVANRIAKGKFSIDGKEYQLALNNGPNALHGGIKGLDKVNWAGKIVGNAVEISHVSPDGDEGYPGALSIVVKFELSEDNELTINYHATTDAPTIVNLTNHTYFNLAGAGGDILEHELKAPSAFYTPVSEDLIPTGALETVKGTPFDFRRPHTIGSRIAQVSNGYDHNLVVNRGKKDDTELVEVAHVFEPKSGRVLDVKSTEPGVQLYTAGFLDGTITGRDGKVYNKFGGFCLETQHFPDAVNQPTFASVVLRPGEQYDTTTVFKFSVPRSNSKRKSTE